MKSSLAILLGSSLLVAMTPEDARAVWFRDQQVRVVDHEEYYDEWIVVSNLSAFYFQEGATALALVLHGGGGWSFPEGTCVRV